MRINTTGVPPSRIYSHPANEFVASFVGSPQMNLLTLSCGGNKVTLGKYALPLPDLQPMPQQVVCGIRPEDVTLANSEAEASFMGQVYLVEQLGKENLVSMRVKDSEHTIRALLTSDRDWQDSTIPLKIRPEKIHWFDIKTGDRL